jgi:LysM repeat protein
MNAGFRMIRLAGWLGFALLWVSAGCTQMGGVGERPRKGPAYYEHKVKWKGESLSIIAQWYTGNAENWKVLAKINPGIDPNRIQIGERVRIPVNLMKTKKPMPERFVASIVEEKRKTPPARPELKPSKPKKKTTSGPPKEIKTKPPPKPAYYEHNVRWSGESLSIIAKWYTGSLENWKALSKANPKINPSRIHKGQKIRIPENLLKTREPMPKRFLSDVGKRKPKAPPSEPQPPPPDEEEPQLFGPKPYPKK